MDSGRTSRHSGSNTEEGVPLYASKSQPSRKWCGFFTPNFASLDVINRLGNIVYGLNGCAAAGHLASAASLTASLGSTLPFFGIAVGIVDLLTECQHYYKGGYGDNTPLWKFALVMLPHLLLIGVGIQEATQFHTFALGVPGCGLLFTAFAIKAGLDFIGALGAWDESKQSNLSNKEISNRFNDILTTGVSLTGWIFLATGHPLGWAFLAFTALTYGYQVCTRQENKPKATTNTDDTIQKKEGLKAFDRDYSYAQVTSSPAQSS
jgi:hypothetical protein